LGTWNLIFILLSKSLCSFGEPAGTHFLGPQGPVFANINQVLVLKAVFLVARHTPKHLDKDISKETALDALRILQQVIC
jgi:hypothetical protein